jgi:hypothetical protein
MVVGDRTVETGVVITNNLGTLEPGYGRRE